MATDATGTPTSLGIPTFLVGSDAPTGNGSNAQMSTIDTLIKARVLDPSTQNDGEALVWDLATTSWKPVHIKINDATKFLRGDGTWAVVTSGATVATTVAGLGATADGKQGLIRTGTTPFDFVAVTYDATYAKWVSAEQVIGTLGVGGSQSVGVGSTQAAVNSAVHRFKVLTDAGLVPQIRFTGLIGADTTGVGLVGAAVQLNHASLNISTDTATLYTSTHTAETITTAGVADVPFDTGWLTPTIGTPKDIMWLTGLVTNESGGTRTIYYNNLGLSLRWTS